MGTYTPNPANDPQLLTDLDDSANWTSGQVNSGPHSNADSIAYLRQRLNADDGANWPTGIIQWSDARVLGGSKQYGLVPPVWDAGLARWIGAFGDGSGAYVAWSADGVTWIEQNKHTAAGSQIVGLGANPAGGHVVAWVQTGGTSTDLWNPTTNTYSTFTPGFTGYAPWAVPPSNNWVTINNFNTGTDWVAWGAGIASSSPYSPTIPIFNGPGSVSNLWGVATTWSPPAGFTIHNLAHIVAPFPTSQICLFPTAAGSSASAFMFSTDSSDYSQQPMPTLNTGEAVIDACWDSFTSTIYLLTGTSSMSRVWSYQGTGIPTFTLIAGSTLNHQSYALRCNGRELLRWMQYGTYFTGSAYAPVYRGVRSVDGAKTWQVTPLATTTAPGNGFALRANGQQFLYVNATEFAASKIVGALPNAVI